MRSLLYGNTTTRLVALVIAAASLGAPKKW